MSNPWVNNSYINEALKEYGYPEHILPKLPEQTRNAIKRGLREAYALDLRRQAGPGEIVNEEGVGRDYRNAVAVVSGKASRNDLEPYEGFIPGGQYYVDENGAPASAPYEGSPMHLDTPYRAPSGPVTVDMPFPARSGPIGSNISTRTHIPSSLPRGGNEPGQETSSPQLPGYQGGPTITVQPPSDDQVQEATTPYPNTPLIPFSGTGTSDNPYNIEDEETPSKGPAARAAGNAAARAAAKACRKYWDENGVVPGPETGTFLDYTPIGRRYHATIDMSQYPPRPMTKEEFIRKWPKDGTFLEADFQEKPGFVAGRCTGDGNCWFRAVATHIYGDQELWNYVKAQHIAFLGHVLQTKTHSRHQFYDFLNRLNNGNRWDVRQAADRCTTGYSLTQNLWQKLHVPGSWWGANEIAIITADLYDVFLVISGTRDEKGQRFFEIYGDPQSPNKVVHQTGGNHFIPYLQLRRGGLDWKLEFPSPYLKRYGRVVNFRINSEDWSGIVTQRLSPRTAPQVPTLEQMGYADWAEYDPKALKPADSLMDGAQKVSAMRTYGWSKGMDMNMDALRLCTARGIAVQPKARWEEELVRNDALATSRGLLGNTTPDHQKPRSSVPPPGLPPCTPPQPRNPWPYQNGRFDK